MNMNQNTKMHVNHTIAEREESWTSVDVHSKNGPQDGPVARKRMKMCMNSIPVLLPPFLEFNPNLSIIQSINPSNFTLERTVSVSSSCADTSTQLLSDAKFTSPSSCISPFDVSELPDEIWYRVYGFLHHKSPWDSLPFCDLFRSIGFVSKAENARLMRYIKRVPQDFRYDDEVDRNIDAILWACKHKMKLHKVDFRQCETEVEFGLCLYMLRNCNISDLEIFKVKNFWLFQDDDRNDRIASKLIEAGLPEDEVYESMDSSIFQEKLAEYVPLHAPKLRKVCLESKRNELHRFIPFFSNIFRTLDDVTLRLFDSSITDDTTNLSGMRPRGYDADLHAFTEVIEHMPKLKKLKINACFRASIRVKSKSLKKIDVRSSFGGFWVDECICPNLKILRSSYYVKEELWNGVQPVSRIGTHKELKENYAADKRIIEFSVGKIPFHGMQVPDDCTVNIFLQKKNFS